MPTLERGILFSVVTDDLDRSMDLYAGALELPMRQFSSPIAMFPLDPMGVVEFQVCQREFARDLLHFDFKSERTAGFIVGLKFASASEMDAAAAAAMNAGCELMGQAAGESWTLRDFNGLYWSLALKQ